MRSRAHVWHYDGPSWEIRAYCFRNGATLFRAPDQRLYAKQSSIIMVHGPWSIYLSITKVSFRETIFLSSQIDQMEAVCMQRFHNQLISERLLGNFCSLASRIRTDTRTKASPTLKKHPTKQPPRDLKNRVSRACTSLASIFLGGWHMGLKRKKKSLR